MGSTNKETQTDSAITCMNLSSTSTSYLHTGNFNCDYCGIRWISRATEFSADDIQLFRGVKLCFSCVSEQFLKTQTHNLPPNPWNRRQWILRFVRPDHFNCHACVNFEDRHGVRNCWNGLARVYFYNHFESHSYCAVCFDQLFQLKCPSLHPQNCKRCEKGPLNPRVLRYA